MSDRLAVIGAGQMGNGIAHVCAGNGFEVVMIDVSAEALAKGKGRARSTTRRRSPRWGGSRRRRHSMR
jgi:3-hydroxybutyryl-CoA dehydrogenase